ncbi:ExbD/TolR family protein [Aporhodopirellula rubra]|nr:biopolymer transporter ExbD [Aporhodopirellula rubra]
MRSPSSNRSNSRRGQDRISMTPMIDIVFLLIIFFLVSSHLSRQENRHPVTLASAGTGRLPDSEAGPLTLTLDANSKIYFGGEVISMTELPDRIRDWVNGRDESTANRPTQVRLRIDQSVPYGKIEPVLKEIASLQIRDVSIVVNPNSGNSTAGGTAP